MRLCDTREKIVRKLYPIVISWNPIPAEAGLDAEKLRTWCLTLFGSGCYTRRVPIGRGVV